MSYRLLEFGSMIDRTTGIGNYSRLRLSCLDLLVYLCQNDFKLFGLSILLTMSIPVKLIPETCHAH